jgi:hypothetical protein
MNRREVLVVCFAVSAVAFAVVSWIRSTGLQEPLLPTPPLTIVPDTGRPGRTIYHRQLTKY